MCRICAVTFRVGGVDRQMLRRKVRITSHHLLGFPTRELLEREERRSALHVPGSSLWRRVVPAKILDTDALERLVLGSRADLLDGLTLVREHSHRMLATLRSQDLHRRLVERHGDRAPRLRLVRINPRELA